MNIPPVNSLFNSNSSSQPGQNDINSIMNTQAQQIFQQGQQGTEDFFKSITGGDEEEPDEEEGE